MLSELLNYKEIRIFPWRYGKTYAVWLDFFSVKTTTKKKNNDDHNNNISLFLKCRLQIFCPFSTFFQGSLKFNDLSVKDRKLKHHRLGDENVHNKTMQMRFLLKQISCFSEKETAVVESQISMINTKQ